MLSSEFSTTTVAARQEAASPFFSRIRASLAFSFSSSLAALINTSPSIRRYIPLCLKRCMRYSCDTLQISSTTNQRVPVNKLTGYSDPLAARAGSAVSFMLCADRDTHADVQLVRLVHGDTNPQGPGFIEVAVDSPMTGTVDVVHQPVTPGSFARAPRTAMLANVPAGTLHAFFYPSVVGGREQAIAGCWDEQTKCGYLLAINVDGRLCLRVGAGNGEYVEVTLARRLALRCWYFVAASWDSANGRLTIRQESRINRWNSQIGPVAPFELNDKAEARQPLGFAPAAGCFLIAAAQRSDAVFALFNGKIDRVGLCRGFLKDAAIDALGIGAAPAADVIAFWDTSAGYSDHGIGDVIRDTGPSGFDAVGVNRPIRGMTGWNWEGRDDCFRLNPEQFGGVAFHDDALVDCEWRETLRYEIPEDLPSGVYALRIRANEAEDHVPFFVRPKLPVAQLAVLMPTFTYLAYANEQLGIDKPGISAVTSNVAVLTPDDLEWAQNTTYGSSTYDAYRDGQGICYSSWRRPIFNLRPRNRMSAVGVPWAFPADLSLLWWLETAGHSFDIITDHDLDAEGESALSSYRAIITGTHPEYYSVRMLDGVEDYLAHGGRALYLGGNGFYWATAIRPHEPWCIEVRKLDSGTRAWQASPGEGYLVSTGERSGIWRNRGRPPQKMIGVGFTAQGMDQGRPFERLPDSFDSRAAWIFKGLSETELIGDFGLGLGGAAGIEMDRYDLALGTPPHAYLIAASFGHSDNYPHVSEEVTFATPGRGGTEDFQVRADMVYFTTPNGGAVFSAGSIAWSQALPYNGGRNNVACIVQNVLSKFCSNEPLLD
jgi:N,N-dimethylformamidase